MLANLEIHGNYTLNTSTYTIVFNLYGFGSATSVIQEFSNILINISANVLTGHIRRFAGLVNDHTS